VTGIAFFDVDHTLVHGSTAFLCAGILRREGVLTRLDMVRIAWAHLRHHLGVLDFERVYAMGVKPFVGTSFERGRSLLDEGFRDHVRPNIYREGIDRMEAHRRAGDRVVLLSASSAWLLERFSEVTPIDGLVAFRQHVKDGLFVNDWDRPIPYGANKRILAEAYAAREGVALAACAFYSDSTSDQPLLEVVGRPVAVNPDPRLRWTARRRGWPVEDWTRTLGNVRQ
jgi:HAD superfamily hydrolase (TIGR01490 family)